MKKYTDKKIHQTILAVVARTLGGEPKTFSSTLQLSACETWDSLRQLELMNNLEQAFGITLPAETIIEMTTIQAIEKLVVQYLS